MAKEVMDLKGLVCPQPIMKISLKAQKMNPGDSIEAYANCHTFPDDVKSWCARMGKVLVYCNNEGGVWHVEIQL